MVNDPEEMKLLRLRIERLEQIVRDLAEGLKLLALAGLAVKEGVVEETDLLHRRIDEQRYG